MRTVTSSEAKLTLHKLIDESAKSHQPIFIIGERNSAVLISEEDWTSIQESIHPLLSLVNCSCFLLPPSNRMKSIENTD
jgi:PHD/YefM family antitoxin component YafN of YafNO toxin-antitoxin module